MEGQDGSAERDRPRARSGEISTNDGDDLGQILLVGKHEVVELPEKVRAGLKTREAGTRNEESGERQCELELFDRSPGLGGKRDRTDLC